MAYLGGDRPRPRGLGRATATTSATFLPHCEQRIRVANAASVTFLPTSRASASGSMCRDAPHGHVTRTMKSPRASSSFVMWGSTRTSVWCWRVCLTVHAVHSRMHHCMTPTGQEVQMVATLSAVLGDLTVV